METYFYRLDGPRATFPLDITSAEAELMMRHAQYWQRQAQAGHALVVGPVFDPHRVYGIGVIRVTDKAEAMALVQEDPLHTANLGFSYELHPMPSVILAPALV